LEEGALWLRLTHRLAAASSAWKAAKLLARGGSPGENPLVVQLVAASLTTYWPDDFTSDRRATKDHQPSYELYDTTDSGLIIPR
jgi:hypothetical protein